MYWRWHDEIVMYERVRASTEKTVSLHCKASKKDG